MLLASVCFDIISAMKVSELGEFGLIDLLAEVVSESQDSKAAHLPKPLIGIGDDAAAWYCDKTIELATVDSLIQGVHFTLDTTGWHNLGWKALAISLSDIAAMGGAPRYALISLGLPEYTEVDDVTELYRGMVELGNRFGTSIIGGDTSNAPLIIINAALFGSVPGKAKNVLTRSAARVGDKIAVSGYLGGAAAGLEMLTRKIKLSRENSNTLKEAFLKPIPRVTEGQILLRQGVKAAIDISDGLMADLGHICQASKVGARVEVELVPVHPVAKDNFGEKALEMALAGGEDYELLFTASNDIISKVGNAVSCPITVIGEVTADDTGKITLVDKQGKTLKLDRTGWQHFNTES